MVPIFEKLRFPTTLIKIKGIYINLATYSLLSESVNGYFLNAMHCVQNYAGKNVLLTRRSEQPLQKIGVELIESLVCIHLL